MDLYKQDEIAIVPIQSEWFQKGYQHVVKVPICLHKNSTATGL